jgi:hypothetical protein
MEKKLTFLENVCQWRESGLDRVPLVKVVELLVPCILLLLICPIYFREKYLVLKTLLQGESLSLDAIQLRNNATCSCINAIHAIIEQSIP